MANHAYLLSRSNSALRMTPVLNAAAASFRHYYSILGYAVGLIGYEIISDVDSVPRGPLFWLLIACLLCFPYADLLARFGAPPAKALFGIRAGAEEGELLLYGRTPSASCTPT